MKKIWLCLCLLLNYCIADDTGEVTLDGSTLGRRFDGIGGLSGGGATSRFLPSYEDPYRSEILDYLFLPNFAASLHILKVEIGGDCQTTEGTEDSHMHYRDDLNYNRGYEWWLMTEAKKRNPDILLYGLSWGVPGWIGNGSFFSQDNIDYHIKWLDGARAVYGLEIDYIGVWNERSYDVDWIIDFRKALDANGYQNTMIVGNDGNWVIVDDLVKNETFKEAVGIVGVHYPGTTSPEEAQDLGNPLWASEDYSSYSDSAGGSCWGRIVNQNYVNGFMTSTISWNLIASYYDQLPYGGDGLMWALYPWSGNYEVTSPVWVTAHTTQFTKPGWTYLSHGSGVGHLPQGGSYVTLVPPNNEEGDFSLIIETFTHDQSVCIRPALPPYNISAQTVTFTLEGGLGKAKTLHKWYTHLSLDGNNTYFEYQGTVDVSDNQFTLDLDLNSVTTISTLTGQNKGQHPTPPPSSSFPREYVDDFDSYPISSEANYFMDQTGVWEIYQGEKSKVMRQVVTIPPIVWCGESDSPISLVGTFTSYNAHIVISAMIEDNGTVGVGLRVPYGGCGNNFGQGYFFTVASSGDWELYSGGNKLTAGHEASISANHWFSLSISGNGPTICAFIEGVQITCANDTDWTSGFAAIFSGWNFAQFDNLYLVSDAPTCGTGAFIQTTLCNETAENMLWTFPDDGTVRLKAKNDVCLTVAPNKTSSSSISIKDDEPPSLIAALCADPPSSSQQWKYDGIQLINVPSSQCADIFKADDRNCRTIDLYECNGGTNQQWGVQDNMIVSALNGYCLAATSGSQSSS